jgi:deoxynucleoside triphosphate triphosphohydrolase SAMHD1
MQEQVAEYKKLIETFVENQLRDYINYIQRTQKARTVKEINDAIWGTISLHPLEVIILDSPLFQRLRYIRQLGVVHWIYPSAGHSRLEHSIGTIHQVQQFITSINKQCEDPIIKSEWTNLLRLAALCHDIGHGFMSHVVENALDASGVISKLLLHLKEYLGKDYCRLSEAAAYFILGSKAFSDLLEVAKTKTNHRLPPKATELLQKAVLSQKISPKHLLLQELISGPFDADKLDYMTRDAQMAGVPVVTDIPRLIQKIRAVQVTYEELPENLKRIAEKSDNPIYWVYGIALSGGRTLDELMLGRTLLFDKVYRHQKVRAIEAMIENII